MSINGVYMAFVDGFEVSIEFEVSLVAICFFQLNGSVVNVIWLLYMQLYLITTVLDHFTLTMQQ